MRGDVIDGNIAVIGDTILIEEIEYLGSIQCDCLFDVDYQLMNVSSGLYTVKVIHLEVLRPEDRIQIFQIDLDSQASGSYCETRTYPPWGIY